MHITLPIDSSSLIVNDVPESMGLVSENGNRSKIAVCVEAKEEVDRISGSFRG